MVRPIVKKSGSGDGTGGPQRRMSQRGMEWSLRSLRQIDTNAKYFAQTYYDSESESDSDTLHEADQTAYEIFKGKQQESSSSPNGEGNGSNITGNIHGPSSVWAALNAPLRTGVVDGRKVIFELRENVTQKPETPRSERLQRRHVVLNGHRSSFETRCRLWLMHFNVSHLSIIYFTSFIGMNVVFAGLFFLDQQRCCGDADFTFADVFNFSVQTSTTIGYGTFSPDGHWANFLVVILSYMATLMNTLFAGLLFTKFVTPVVNIQFSEVMTIANVNGVPCLSIRLGAPDGDKLNPMTDINVRLTYSYQIPYADHKGEQKFFRQTEDLQLLSNRQHGMKEGSWTLRHILDESSPLFGLNFEEHPANKIYVFTLSVDAVQDLTKSSVNVQTEYAVEDILIGHAFTNMVVQDDHYDNATTPQPSERGGTIDFESGNLSNGDLNKSIHNGGGGDFRKNKKRIKHRHQHNNHQKKDKHPFSSKKMVIARNFDLLSETAPYPVWYPAKKGAYAEDQITFASARTFGA